MSTDEKKISPIGGIFADLDSLRLTDVTASVAKEVCPGAATRKARSNEFFRVHPDHELATSVYIEKPTNEVYLVAPNVRHLMVDEMKASILCQARTRQGVDIIIPVAADGSNEWGESLRNAVALAKQNWVRVKADMHLGAYRIYKAEGALGEPEWPEKSFNELLEGAFKGKVIDSENHPVVRRLRGLE